MGQQSGSLNVTSEWAAAPFNSTHGAQIAPWSRRKVLLTLSLGPLMGGNTACDAAMTLMAFIALAKAAYEVGEAISGAVTFENETDDPFNFECRVEVHHERDALQDLTDPLVVHVPPNGSKTVTFGDLSTDRVGQYVVRVEFNGQSAESEPFSVS